ncbi:MAG: hypothetical protein ABW044_06750 [Cellvibrio sp.]
MSIDTKANKSDDKNLLRVVTSSIDPDEPLALLDFGDVNFLVSSKDILTLSSAQKMTAPTLAQACGKLLLEDGEVPVFAINKALQLNPERPSNHLTLVVLKHQTRVFGLCCVTLEKIEMQNLNFFTVPVSMTSRKQPFSQFALVNKQTAGLTSAFDLLRLLTARGVVLPAAEQKPIQEAG